MLKINTFARYCNTGLKYATTSPDVAGVDTLSPIDGDYNSWTPVRRKHGNIECQSSYYTSYETFLEVYS